jgi:hypothetical protein
MSDLTAVSTNGLHRVCAEVNGVPLWFESRDARLFPSPESLASALLIPALASQSALKITPPICSQWASQAPQIMALLREWWQYLPIPLQLCSEPLPQASAPTRTGLCFTGGVDSFFTLLRSDLPVDTLIFAHGYDMDVEDTARLAAFEPQLRQVAAATGTKAVVVRTNLRRHPAFAPHSWERTHGGALAAIGHLLSEQIGTLIISSSYPFADPHPWGTSWQLDPLWSSARLQVKPFGATHWRTEKLRDIAAEPLVRDHLRVCWENRNTRLNCSRCEKCLRTQLVLATCGQLEHYTVFETTTSLAERLDSVPKIPNADILIVYEKFLGQGLKPDVEAAVRRLVGRSQRAALWNRWKQPLRRMRARLRRGRG